MKKLIKIRVIRILEYFKIRFCNFKIIINLKRVLQYSVYCTRYILYMYVSLYYNQRQHF